MASINKNIDAVRRYLGKPRDSAPNVDSILGAIIDETNLFNGELGNSGQPFTKKTFNLNLNSSRQDYKVSGGESAGKILFVTGNVNNYAYGYPVEFTDLSDASPNWWSFFPNASDRPEDFGYWSGYGSSIAFYRKDGDLYARTPYAWNRGNLTITAAQGAFTGGLNDVTALPEYHALINVRAALTELPNAEWTDNFDRDEVKRKNLMAILPQTENRIYEQFRIAKRSLNADDVVFIETIDEWF